MKHARKTGTVVVVTARREYLSGFPEREWATRASILIRQDDGQLFMYPDLSNEEDIELLGRDQSRSNGRRDR